jgi:hypothetical protein
LAYFIQFPTHGLLPRKFLDHSRECAVVSLSYGGRHP